MSDTVKVIIEIPKKVFEARKIGEISPWVTVPILDAVQNGIPLEDIKAEIKEHRDSWEKDGYCDEADALNIALEIIDKHIGKAESKDPNNLSFMFDGVTAFKGWTTEEMLEQIRAESEGK